MDNKQLNEMVDGYIEAAAWADCPESSLARFPRAEIDKARRVCARFVEACGPLAAMAIGQPGYGAARFGVDFWLTRVGHGAGYWDRDELTATVGQTVTFFDRDGRTQASQPGDTIGDALEAICYGTSGYISPFAYAELYAYRGWLYFYGDNK